MKIVYIRSRRSAFGKDGKPALKCNPDGSIQANTFGEALECEKWTLHEVVLGEDNDQEMPIVALQSWTGKYLSAKPDGSVKADADHIETSEQWRIESNQRPQEQYYIALKSRHHGKYLVCDDSFDCGKSVRADRNQVKEWEEWVIVDNPEAFTDPGHTLKMAVGGTMVVAGGLLSVGALAVPFVGFGVEGVVGGSIAAWLQSLLYGGATGGVFSVLQSAGATLAWMPAAAGGAATAGAGAVVGREAPVVEENQSTGGVFSVLQPVGATLAWIPAAAGGAATAGASADVVGREAPVEEENQS